MLRCYVVLTAGSAVQGSPGAWFPRRTSQLTARPLSGGRAAGSPQGAGLVRSCDDVSDPLAAGPLVKHRGGTLAPYGCLVSPRCHGVQETFRVTQPAADNALRQLQEAGALSKPKTVHGEGQKRNIVWQANDVLEALDRFGERARRTSRTG